MREPADAPVPSGQSPDGDGIRIIPLRRTRAGRLRSITITVGLCLLVVAPLLILVLPSGSQRPPAASAAVPATAAGTSAVPARAPDRQPETSVAAAGAPPAVAVLAPQPAPLPPRDPNDLASYARPGDPEPTMAEVISALRETGEREGIAAFNPPGTSPPLVGLAVPADYVLPPGYVRHHQVTDQGEPIEPILMYAPDAVLFDAAGQPVPIPEDRVVPPERAPAGLPIRQVELPTP